MRIKNQHRPVTITFSAPDLSLPRVFSKLSGEMLSHLSKSRQFVNILPGHKDHFAQRFVQE